MPASRSESEPNLNQRQGNASGTLTNRAGRRIDIGGDDLPHVQVLRRIEADIRTGRLARGERLASERDLGARLGVARNTLRRALGDLQSRGLLESRGRGGWVVTAALTERVDGPQGLTEWARRHGFGVRSIVRTHGVRPASDDEALRLRIATGAPVFELERVRVLDRVPLSLDRSILHPRLAPILADVDFAATSLYATLRDRGAVVPTRTDVVLRAIPAVPAIAELLDVTDGAALLEVSETVFDQYGDPFEAATLVNRGDRYAFGTSLAANSRQVIELGRGT